MMMYFMSYIFSFFSALIVFILNRKHYLLMLLSLEFGVLALYLNMYFFLMNMMNEFFFLMIFLTMSVCEGVLGLAVLILMIRTFGNDHILTFSSLW